MDLTLVYIFIAAIAAVLSFGVVSVDDRNVRRMLLVMLLSTIGVGTYMEQIKAKHTIDKYHTCVMEAYADNVCDHLIK